MFGRATIRLGIGPHSSFLLFDRTWRAAPAEKQMTPVEPDGMTSP